MALADGIRKVAVDTLYQAREDGKVMDEAAVLVAEAVLAEAGNPELRERIKDLVEAGYVNAGLHFNSLRQIGDLVDADTTKLSTQ